MSLENPAPEFGFGFNPATIRFSRPSSPSTSESTTNGLMPPSPVLSPLFSDDPTMRSPPADTPPIVDEAVLDVDPQIVEALKSAKDRLYVLKLGEQMEALITERSTRTRIDLTTTTSYQRLLVHRCAAYYKLAPENDTSSKGIVVLITLESRIPSRRLSDLVPAEQTAHPTFKIMRRAAAQDRIRAKVSSGDSVTGEDDLSDREPSEAGSLGGRSNATGSSSAHTKKRMTIAEREAAYNEARSRIFMDFEEKEKEKERGMSASSSTLSLASASTSAGGGGSSLGDIDDGRSTAATESEWSAPITRDGKTDVRRDSGSGHNSVAGPSSRSLRSTATSFNANGSGSARGSRAASPSFTFPSLYEASSSTSFDAAQAAHAPPPGYIAHYIYPPYPPPPGQMPGQGYLAPYGYYPAYPYPFPQQPSPTGIPVPAGPPGGDNNMVPPQHQHQHQHQHLQQQQHPDPQQAAAYMNPYMWAPPHLPTPAPGPGVGMGQNPPHIQQPQRHPSTHGSAPPQHPHVSQYTYPTPGMPYAPYAIPGYYPPQPAPGQLMHVQNQTQSMPALQNGGMNGSGVASANSSMNGSPHQSRRNSNSSQGTSHGNPNLGNGVIMGTGGGKRGLQPTRSPWSFGPGIGGFASGGMGFGGGDVVGPRLSMRRTSNTSSGGGSAGNRTPGDEASSTASSSTGSSSSRRTFTSSSSKHPLPARPDWAVGLKPQPTLSTHTRHGHHDSNSNSRTMSPARQGVISLPHTPPHQSSPVPQSTATSQLPPNILQATDFPPLTSLNSAPEKRAPVVGGAWTNTSSTRSILAPSPGHANANSYGKALVQNHASGSNSTAAAIGGSIGVNAVASTSSTRLDEQDRGFERPPPKGGTELFNPKNGPPSNGVRRPLSGQQVVADKGSRERSREKEKEKSRGEAVANAILVDRLGAMSLDGSGSDGVDYRSDGSTVGSRTVATTEGSGGLTGGPS